MSAKILVVEDEKELQASLRYVLQREGYEVVIASDGEEALNLARTQSPDLVLLDIMLPRLNGLEVCRALRRTSAIPIIMLTAKTDEVNKVVGLELGADDYVTKPFSMRELLARVRAALGRAKASPPMEGPGQPLSVRVNDIELDMAHRQILLNGTALALKPKGKEFALLAFLVQNRGIVFSRDTLLEKVWGYEYAGGTRTVDVHMRWLRQKIETNPSRPRRIVTVRGTGYRFEG